MTNSPDPARSPAVQRFIASLGLTMDQWREGEGFDLSALQGLSNPEAACVLDLLNERLEGSTGGWRDVEAMAALDIPPARMALLRLSDHPSAEVRLRAARLLDAKDPKGATEREIVRLLDDPETDIGAAALIDRAEEYSTPAVRAALLRCALDGAPHLRVHAAALALFFGGGAEEPFDWNHRPMFLQFGEESRAARLAAMEKLTALMHQG
jgi:hypothetical protein